jgi:hypothetical protein
MAKPRRPDDASSEPRTQITKAAQLPRLPADRYGELDSESLKVIDLQRATRSALTRRLGLRGTTVDLIVATRKRCPLASPAQLLAQRRGVARDLARIHGRVYYAGEAPLHIVDVLPDEHVLSDRSFALNVRFQNASDAAVVVASVAVHWAGDPFVVEQEVTAGEAESGVVTVRFDRERALPVGRAEFRVTLCRADGAQASFRRTVYVLPSNPLSLSLGPAGARVTGSWSARGDYQPGSDTFLTEIEITLANGDAGSVSMSRRVDWEFWDGGVGTGTRVEAGSFDWPNAISVPSFGVWRGSAWFSSPRGSGIFNVYDRKEDMAISISMRANDGRVVRGEITARVMLAFGVNIIKVGDFAAQEHVDLYAAVDQMRQIYEQRDITLRGVDRRIISNAQAGSYTILNSEDEFRDLLEDWSVPNDFVDVYVVQQFSWSTFNGFAGDIPGPAAKGGRRDGIAGDKTGFTDASGTSRLDVTTLAQLIGHEIGHYLGLQHLENTNNLMRSNTGNRGPNLDYDQYRTMFPHGFMVYQ